jgi:osmotically-inducible protein OsmY
MLAAMMHLLLLTVPAFAGNMDTRIEASARESYVFRSYLQDDTITVYSRDGAVTLTGIVSENFHKALAQETVSGLSGVKRVDNRLEIKGAAPTANSDAWLRDRVHVALLFHHGSPTARPEVDVRDGVATLRGTTDSQVQKEKTSEYARHVDGIREVKNEMTVSGSAHKKSRSVAEKIDDASISAQVNMTLLNHRTTSVLNTTVKTMHGVVTVAGTARNARERKLVTRLVSDIQGVTKVRNRMTIE